MANVFIGMETSGVLRRAFQAAGHDVISCDLLPAVDVGFGHIQGDVFEVLDRLKRKSDWWPELAIFHPTCTYLTISAAWAFNDPDFDKYPGVGYHQKVKPGTLVGADRRNARDEQIQHVDRLWKLPIRKKVVENPIGSLSTMWRKPTQVVQPFWAGDDASKATCFWIDGLMPLRFDPAWRCAGRMAEWPKGSGKLVERWSNQTDSGQSNATPSDDRWQQRSETFPLLGNVMVQQWSLELSKEAKAA